MAVPVELTSPTFNHTRLWFKPVCNNFGSSGKFESGVRKT
jgi:hypothetical protein